MRARRVAHPADVAEYAYSGHGFGDGVFALLFVMFSITYVLIACASHCTYLQLSVVGTNSIQLC